VAVGRIIAFSYTSGGTWKNKSILFFPHQRLILKEKQGALVAHALGSESEERALSNQLGWIRTGAQLTFATSAVCRDRS